MYFVVQGILKQRIQSNNTFENVRYCVLWQQIKTFKSYINSIPIFVFYNAKYTILN